jgi:hypothetical protein
MLSSGPTRYCYPALHAYPEAVTACVVTVGYRPPRRVMLNTFIGK